MINRSRSIGRTLVAQQCAVTFAFLLQPLQFCVVNIWESGLGASYILRSFGQDSIRGVGCDALPTTQLDSLSGGYKTL